MGGPWPPWLWSFAVLSRVVADDTCSAVGGGAGCSASGQGSGNCLALGFDSTRLRCTTCDTLKIRLAEAGTKVATLVDECLGCCHNKSKVAERFDSARLIADARQQDRDQDLHDFIKRKAPLFPALDVEYMEDVEPGIELERKDQPDRVVRADTAGWKSDHIFDFLKARLEMQHDDGKPKTATAGAWTAEIQSCSGWRLNQLPEARKFIKEPGHADTYAGLKVNFIPHHNPDLVFFNQHGEEIERLDLGPYSSDQIHKLMQEKGFQRKQSRKYKAEIRTCPGWRLNQLPEVRRFIKEPQNAQMYIGIRLNYVPHHHPYLIMLDEEGKEGDWIDLTEYDFQGLTDLFESKGFKKKELV